MRTVKIITDSTADLPKSLRKTRGIDMAPLHIILGEETFPDDGSHASTELFDFADKHKTLPKSAAVNEYQFDEIFKKWLDQDYDIFFMGISSKLSATMQSALNAAETLDKERISIVDSLSLSTGTGLQVLEASDLAQQGVSLREITDHALAIRGKVQASFVVDTLKYLYMGGRCSRLASVIGSRLQIKPMLELIDGEIVPGVKFRGSHYVEKYYHHIMAEPEAIDPKRIFVTHCLSEHAEPLKQQIQKDHGFKNVMITDASPTISVHCGPGTIGILYIRK
jgi:DegV family protein with EDD domain